MGNIFQDKAAWDSFHRDLFRKYGKRDDERAKQVAYEAAADALALARGISSQRYPGATSATAQRAVTAELTIPYSTMSRVRELLSGGGDDILGEQALSSEAPEVKRLALEVGPRLRARIRQAEREHLEAVAVPDSSGAQRLGFDLDRALNELRRHKDQHTREYVANGMAAGSFALQEFMRRFVLPYVAAEFRLAELLELDERDMTATEVSDANAEAALRRQEHLFQEAAKDRAEKQRIEDAKTIIRNAGIPA